MKKIIWLAAALCLAGVLAACGGQSANTTESSAATGTATDSAEATGAPAAGGSTLTIANMGFGQPITVAPGATITIKNDDSVEHSVTSRTEGQFSVDVDGKEQRTLTAPTTPGEYAFYCKYHPSMNGTLIVK